MGVGMRRFDDVLVMRYVDGELDPEAARTMRQRLAADPDAAARAETFRTTRRLLFEAFAGEIAGRARSAARMSAARRLAVRLCGTRRPV